MGRAAPRRRGHPSQQVGSPLPPLHLIATAAMGLESVVAAEVRRLGYTDVRVENGKVHIFSTTEAIPRLNLWLRAADRVLVQVGQFPARTFEDLFQGTRELPWPEWLPEDAHFVVSGRSVDSQLHSVPACQAVAEKAIVESLKRRYRRQWFPKTGARYDIEVALVKDVATLTLNTSGPGLHRRGYRTLMPPAPLRENLAAALVLLCRWHPDQPLLDPCCGSAPIPIEAALLGRNLAPGLLRTVAAEHWGAVPAELWRRAREEARDLAQPHRPLAIYASDIDPAALDLAWRAAAAAGVADALRFRQVAVDHLDPPPEEGGWIITNPPYGQRLGEDRAVAQLYRDLGRLSRRLPTWGVGVLTAHPRFQQLFGRPAARNRKLYNGRIRCYFYQYPPPRRHPATATGADPGAGCAPHGAPGPGG